MLSHTAENRIRVAVAIVTFLFVAAVAWIPPASQYEPSLVSSVPPFVWALFYTSSIGSTVLIIYGATYNRPVWRWGFGLVVITYAAFFALPLARQYVMYGRFGFDSWVHFGFIKDILVFGAIPDLTYPATHLLGTTLVVLSDIQIVTIQPVFAYWFKLLLIVGAFTCARSLSENRTIALLTSAAALPIIYLFDRIAMGPWLYGLTLLPFILQYVFDYNRANDRRMVFPLALCSAALVLYHPISTVFAVCAVALLLVSYRFGPRFAAKEGRYVYGWIFVICLVTGLMVWHLTHPTVEGSIRGTFISIFAQEAGAGTSTADRAAETDYTLLQMLIRFIIPVWGIFLVYHAITAFGSAVVSYRTVRNYATNTEWNRVSRLIERIPLAVPIAPSVLLSLFRNRVTAYEESIVAQFVFGIFLGGAFMVVDIHAGGNIFRAMQYSLLFAIFGVGLTIWLVSSELESPRISAVLTIALVLLLLVSLAFTTGTVYQDHRHITEAAMAGQEWNLDNKDMNQVTYSDAGRTVFAWHHLGYSDAKSKQRSDDRIRTEGGLSPHLGYHNGSTIRDWLPENGYVMIRTKDMIWYQAEPEWRHEDLEYFTQEDYQRLVNDRTAHRPYDNGEVRIWYVRAADT